MSISAELNFESYQPGGAAGDCDLEFVPGNLPPLHFDVIVTNQGDRVTPFQIELSILELDWVPDTKWYRVEPHIISRKAGNQITNFHIEILDLPSPVTGAALKLCLKIVSSEFDYPVEEKYLTVKVGDRQKSRLVNSQILLTDFRRELRFIPGSEDNPDSELEILVTNQSDRFTSFKLELLPIDTDLRADPKWYTVEPQVSTKKPPGETTSFHLRIINEPIAAYDSTLDLILRIFSVEDESLQIEQRLKLIIESPLKPLRLSLPTHRLKVMPGDGIDIPVWVHSLSPRRSQITLSLAQGTIPISWFASTGGLVPQKTVTLSAGDSQQVTFHCCPPLEVDSLSQIYQFELEARSTTSSYIARAVGELEVLPWGSVAMQGVNPQVTIPVRGSQPEGYIIQFENRSNVPQKICLQPPQDASQPGLVKLPMLSPPSAPGHAQPPSAVEVEVSCPYVELNPGKTAAVTLKPALKRSLLGWKRRHLLAIAPTLLPKASSSTIDLKPPQQILELIVYPILPFFLQVGGAVLLLFLLALAWLLNPRSYHQGSVNSVRLMGNGGTVVSGASDQTIRRWQVSPSAWIPDVRRLSYEGIIADEVGKAVRVIRQIPEHDHQIAAGLENGTIQLWDVALGEQIRSFTVQGGDRVFDLDFTRDSRYLLSGHGSGFVRLWDLESDRQTPVAQTYPKFVISALAVQDDPGGASPLVAIAGQYNRLLLWDWQGEQLYEVDYQQPHQLDFTPVVGQYDYINSIDISDDQRRLVTADSQGYITLWDMQQLRQCVQRQGGGAQASTLATDGMGNGIVRLNCANSVLDQWRDEDNPQPVRSVALSQTGCHLASVGDDGRVRLWHLGTGDDAGVSRLESPVQLAKFANARLNSVDIIATRDHLLIASDINQNRIRLFRRKRTNRHADCQ